LTYFGLANN